MTSTSLIPIVDSVFDCDTCTNTVEQVLQQTAGVQEVQIDDKSSRLAVEYETTRIGEDEIRGIVEEWGYAPSGSG